MDSAKPSTLLLADIGGTHIRLALARPDDSSLNYLARFRCADFDSVAAVLKDYLSAANLAAEQRQPAQACFAVAAPVSASAVPDEIIMTNSNWRFSVGATREMFGWERLHILNDFEAVAHSIPMLHADSLVQVGGGTRVGDGNMVVLGPGTGLGVKHLVSNGQSWKVLAGEGGHVDFAPVDEADLALWHFIRKAQGRVSVEEILSGRGLVHIYRSMAGTMSLPAPLDIPEEIVKQGLAGECDICQQSLQHFCRILGTFAGNLALNLNTTGGVYLCGGVLGELTGLMKSSDFRNRFEAKGGFRNYVKDIPVFLIAEQEPGLRGALAYLNVVLNGSRP